jgi:hypothetical protein
MPKINGAFIMGMFKRKIMNLEKERPTSMPSPIRLKRYLLALLAVLFVQAPLAHSALISIQPDFTLASEGDSISLDLVVSELGDFGTDSLGAFDLFVGFDASVLSFTNYFLGDFLGDVGLAEAIDASSGDVGGAVSLAEVSLLSAIDLDALQPDEFILATLEFDVINLAAGAMTQLSVMSGAVLADAFGEAIAVTGMESASVTGVPVPGTGLLLLASLFAWLTLKRRQSV